MMYNREPVFSILIANYNNGQYLMDAIRSVQAQTYRHWEIIIVDDGSTDCSHDLYQQLVRDCHATITTLTDEPLPMPTVEEWTKWAQQAMHDGQVTQDGCAQHSTLNAQLQQDGCAQQVMHDGQVTQDGCAQNSTLNAQLQQDGCAQQATHDGQVRIYLSPSNHGCGFTKHQCAALAHGELCGFLDPDDALTPDALEVMVAAHRQHPEAAVVGSCYWATDENLKPMWHTDQWVYTEGKDYLTDFQHLRPIHFATYKNERYLQTEGISADIKRAVDMDLYVKLEEQGRIVFLPDITYYYRQHTHQISTHGDFKSMYWEIVVIQKACQRRGLEAEKLINDMMAARGKYYVENFLGYPLVPRPKASCWAKWIGQVKHLLAKIRK